MKKVRLIILGLLVTFLLPTHAFANENVVTEDELAKDSVFEDPAFENTIPKNLLAKNLLTNEITPLGAGAWDTILTSDYTVYSSPSVTRTRTVLSGGGNIRVCLSGVNTGNRISVQVTSDDTIDRTITWLNFYSGSSCSGSINVNAYKDGSYAEIYLLMQGQLASDNVTVRIDD